MADVVHYCVHGMVVHGWCARAGQRLEALRMLTPKSHKRAQKRRPRLEKTIQVQAPPISAVEVSPLRVPIYTTQQPTAETLGATMELWDWILEFSKVFAQFDDPREGEETCRMDIVLKLGEAAKPRVPNHPSMPDQALPS